jgi:DNA-binding transcriptional LysR family regulator
VEVRRLRYFVTVADELHFGNAARLLHIAQPALSQQIRVLEREVGAALFERNSRGVALTAAGAALLPDARDILERVAGAVEHARRAARGEDATLRLAHTRSAPSGPAKDLETAFRAQYPNTQVVVSVGHTSQNAEYLHARRIDAAFVHPPLDDDQLATHTLCEEALVAAVPAGHPLSRRRAVRIAQLAEEPVVSWPAANGPGMHAAILRQVWPNAEPFIVREEPDEHHMLLAVAEGVGVAVCTASSLGRSRFASVRIRPFAPPVPTVPLALAWRAEDDNPAVRQIVALVTASVPTLQGRGADVAWDT